MRILYLSFVVVFLVGCLPPVNEKLTIACAANVQYAMEELAETFQKEFGIDCNIVVSSSGKLTAQIIEGAPYDVFLSADMKYPIELYGNRLSNVAPKAYAYGQLILWTNKEDVDLSITALAHPEIRHIAIANPKTAPYGEAAMEVFKQSGLLEKLESRLVYGESISQTNQFILSGAADVGITAKSSLFSPHTGNDNWQDIDTTLYSPIAQGVVVLNHREQHQDDAQKFYEFLFSVKGKEILNKFGYSTPK